MEICTQEHAAQLGYMPYRDDFEREYDVTAEQLVSNLALTSDDDEIESALKLAVVDIYNRRLRERARKKRIARDYRLIQEFFRKFENGKGKSINQTKDERGLRLSLKNFRQFYSNDAFERLIYSLERERILRIRLTELCRYRWNGLTKIDECEHFEKHAAANHHRTSCPFGFGHYKQVSLNLFMIAAHFLSILLEFFLIERIFWSFEKSADVHDFVCTSANVSRGGIDVVISFFLHQK